MKQSYKQLINRREWTAEIEEYGQWLKKIKEALQNCNYTIDEANITAINNIRDAIATTLAWISRSPTADNFIPPKTPFIFGPTGTGKTFLMQIIAGRFNGIKFIDVDKMQEVEFYDLPCWIRQFDDITLIIDDVGTETSVKNMAGIITHREKLWKNDGILTIYTSNIKNQQELEKYYGTRIKSRIKGQCQFIPLTGPDRR